MEKESLPILTESEQKKAISAVLSELRKKDLQGLLSAQRSNSLDQFIAPYLDEYIRKKYSNNSSTIPSKTSSNISSNNSSNSPSNNKSSSSNLRITSTSPPPLPPSHSSSTYSPPPSKQSQKILQSPNVENIKKNISTVTPSSNNQKKEIKNIDLNTNESENNSIDENEDGQDDEDEDFNLENTTPSLSPKNSNKSEQTSPSISRGRRISQYAGTAMDSGCEVWAKPSGTDDWVKAIVRSITPVVIQESKYRTNKGQHKRSSMFILDLQNDQGDIIGDIKLESSPVEGSLEEYEYVKLRNLVDDDEEGVEKVQDLITLSYLHEPAILCCLRKRFERNLIYTNTGPILIAVVSVFIYIYF